MNLAAKKDKSYPAIMKLKVEKEKIIDMMSGGREVAIPIAWYDRLAKASMKQLKSFQVSPGA